MKRSIVTSAIEVSIHPLPVFVFARLLAEAIQSLCTYSGLLRSARKDGALGTSEYLPIECLTISVPLKIE